MMVTDYPCLKIISHGTVTRAKRARPLKLTGAD